MSPGRYVVHYAEGFSVDEFHAVIDEMLESSVSPLVLAGFEPLVPRSRLEEMQNLLRRASGSSPRVHLALSRIAERLDDGTTARDALLKAVILAKGTPSFT